MQSDVLLTPEVDLAMGKEYHNLCHLEVADISSVTGRERLIRSHSSARFSFELSGNSN